MVFNGKRNHTFKSINIPVNSASLFSRNFDLCGAVCLLFQVNLTLYSWI